MKWVVRNLSKSIGKQKPIFIALAITCLLGFAVILLNLYTGGLSPVVPRESQASFTMAAVVFMAAPVLVIWGAHLYFRCSDMAVTRYIGGIVVLLIFELLVVLVKYSAQSSTVVNICAYLHFVPFLFVPALFLCAGLRIALFSENHEGRKICFAVCLISIALSLLVITNDLHESVVCFDCAHSRGSSGYIKRQGYWVVVAWTVVEFLVFLALLFHVSAKRSRCSVRRLRKGFLPLTLIAILGIFAAASTYCFGYVFHGEALLGGGFALAYSAMAAFTLEFCFALGFFPSSLQPLDAFYGLPVDARIFSTERRQIFATSCAHPLDTIETNALNALANVPERVMSLCVLGHPDTSYILCRLSKKPQGGLLLLTKDRAALNWQQRWLNERQVLLNKKNVVLEQEVILEQNLRRHEFEQDFLNKVSYSLQSAVTSIRILLDKIPKITDEKSTSEREHQLMLVKLLATYCKRKGNLVLFEQDNSDFDDERLQLAFNETIADIRSAGIESAALITAKGPYSIQAINILYDCFYDMIFMAFECTNPVLMIFMNDKGQKCIELRVKLECDDAEDLHTNAAVVALRASLDKRDVVYRLIGQQGSLHLIVIASKRDTLKEMMA